jgi:predicted glycoside hydrolase/deacetylase ChbG (UPF0249 family)
MYLAERLEEVRTLCDLRVGAALREADIRLLSFSDIA